ncbi:MAG: hypothetical protein TH68_06595, partial [Candidatus Synechococcus spongiarum 142]
MTLSHTATGGDYNSVMAALAVTVTDDDTPDLVLSPRALMVTEADSATYTVKLSNQPSAAVTVTVRGTGSGVSVDTDPGREGEQTSLSFTTDNWNTARTVTVAAAEDDNASPETVTLNHTATRGGYASVKKKLVVTVTDTEAAGLVLSPMAVTVAEADSATYTVKLASEPNAAVTVTVSGMGSGVSVDTDPGMEGGQTSLSFTTSNWEMEQTVTVSAAADDNLISEEVTLSHTAIGGDYDLVMAKLAVTVTDTETAGLVLSSAALTVAEANSDAYTVKLATKPTDAVTVTFSGMGSAVSVDTDAGTDGEQTSLNFTTSNWEMEQTVTVSAAADDNAVSEEVMLSHTATGGGYGSVSQELVVTVMDDDTPDLVLSPVAVTVAEAASATYTVMLATEPTTDVTVTVSGMGNGASIDTDGGMQGEQTTLNFTTDHWNTAQTVTVSAAMDDNKIPETATLNHTAAGGDYDGLSKKLVVTMTDDDNICVRLNALNADGTSCNLFNKSISVLSSDDLANLSKIKVLFLGGNNLSSLPADIFADLSNLEALYLNNNNLSSLPAGIFTGLSKLKIIWLSSNNLSSLPADTFAGLSNLETLVLRENNLSTLPADIFSGLSNLLELSLADNNLICLPLIPQSIPQRVISIDVTLPRCYSLELSPGAVTTVEGGSATYTVKLATEPTSDVTVTLGGMGSGVSVDTDLGMEAEQTSLSFTTTDWNTAQTVTVAVAEDDDTNSEVVTLTHTTTSVGTTYSLSRSLRVTVIDNDTPNLVVSPGTVTVAEAGSTTYTVRLVKAPTDAVTVTVRGMGSGVSVDTDAGMPREQTSLTFTTSNWPTEQTVTVRAAADDNAVSEEVRLSHTATGGDYGSVSKDLVVTVTDDDTAGLVLSAAAVTVAEGDSATYTMKLATEPAAAVTVTLNGMGSGVSVDADGGMEGKQTSLSFTTTDWNTARTVTLAAAEDDNASPETVTLS